MITRLTIKKVLGKAIKKEIESRLFYTGLSQKMEDEAVRDAFLKLARQEQGHQNLLEQYQRGELKGALSSRHAVDYKIAEYLDQLPVSADMQYKDVFLLAAKREKASHEFYLALAQIHPPGKVQRLLNELAAQELEHKEKVELLYNDVAFPQTDGG